jgi:hypothetical protein
LLAEALAYSVDFETKGQLSTSDFGGWPAAQHLADHPLGGYAGQTLPHSPPSASRKPSRLRRSFGDGRGETAACVAAFPFSIRFPTWACRWRRHSAVVVSLALWNPLLSDELRSSRNVLEVMRQPLEDGQVTISRASTSLTFPARFMLAAAMNPCPCGFFGDTSRECSCSPTMIQRYVSKISGPLLDRIDIHIEVPAVKYADLAAKPPGEGSLEICNG